MHNLITILGPTATGKTKLAVKLAAVFNGEIISADSRQVYSGMDIGTGKDLEEYRTSNGVIPYHLIDVISPGEEFDLFNFQRLFKKCFAEISADRKIPFLTGGTGLYISSVIKNNWLSKVDFTHERINELQRKSMNDLIELLRSKKEKLHNTTDLKNKERIIKAIIIAEAESQTDATVNPLIRSLNIGVKAGREEIKKMITERLKARLKTGMIEEVENLMKRGITLEKLLFFGLEYKFIGLYLSGSLNYNDMYQKLNSAIHSFAKRQMTWFRKMEREGIEINWVERGDFNSASDIIKEKYPLHA